MTSLLDVLRNPELAPRLGRDDWLSVLACAQRNQVIGQLGDMIRRAGHFDSVPDAAKRRFDLATHTSGQRSAVAQWEALTLRQAVDASIPIVLIKGVAYAACNDANAAGRSFSDIDLLVHKQHLEAVESAAISLGWQPSNTDEYDTRYYRQWMHELPPMTHVRRRTVIDLHHGILPLISRVRVATPKLFDDAVPVGEGLYALSAIDRVIHCAVHTVVDGEAENTLRGLLDLHLLTAQHAATAEQLAALASRAKSLGVANIALPALDAANLVFRPDLAPPVRSASRVAGWLQSAAVQSATGAKLSKTIASMALLAHSHWIKMPLPTLIPHLIHKRLHREPKTDAA